MAASRSSSTRTWQSPVQIFKLCSAIDKNNFAFALCHLICGLFVYFQVRIHRLIAVTIENVVSTWEHCNQLRSWLPSLHTPMLRGWIPLTFQPNLRKNLSDDQYYGLYGTVHGIIFVLFIVVQGLGEGAWLPVATFFEKKVLIQQKKKIGQAAKVGSLAWTWPLPHNWPAQNSKRRGNEKKNLRLVLYCANRRHSFKFWLFKYDWESTRIKCRP